MTNYKMAAEIWGANLSTFHMWSVLSDCVNVRWITINLFGRPMPHMGWDWRGVTEIHTSIRRWQCVLDTRLNVRHVIPSLADSNLRRTLLMMLVHNCFIYFISRGHNFIRVKWSSGCSILRLWGCLCTNLLTQNLNYNIL